MFYIILLKLTKKNTKGFLALLSNRSSQRREIEKVRCHSPLVKISIKTKEVKEVSRFRIPKFEIPNISQ